MLVPVVEGHITSSVSVSDLQWSIRLYHYGILEAMVLSDSVVTKLDIDGARLQMFWVAIDPRHHREYTYFAKDKFSLTPLMKFPYVMLNFRPLKGAGTSMVFDGEKWR